GDQCRKDIPAGELAGKSNLAQIESGRRAHYDSWSYFGKVRPGNTIRPGLNHPGAEALANSGSGRGGGQRSFAAIRAGRCESCATEQLWTHTGKRPDHAELAEFRPGPRTTVQRRGDRRRPR